MTLHVDIELDIGSLCLDVAFDVDDGDVVALLGPNGAGKTTTLRAVAGLLPIDRGQITLGGEVLDDPSAEVFVPPHRRRMGVVFQDHLLFAHMDARDNVAFGLRARGVAKSEARQRADEWLERMQLTDHARSRPATLSGGQAQRVALARALVVEPDLLLLDEPLSALDAQTRIRVRRDLRHHLDTFRGARLLVTHDPVDAVVLASRLVIIEDGRVVQTGTTAEVTARPASAYVADLVGVNLLSGTATVRGTVQLDTGHELALAGPVPQGAVAVAIRPQSIALALDPPGGSARNRWPASVEAVHPDRDRMRVTLAGPVPVTAEITTAALAELRLTPGARLWASVKAVDLEAYPR